jgi:hypothetical protein
MEKIKVQEDKRTYIYADGTEFAIERVVEFAMPGTTHRLTTNDGVHYIIAPGWIAIRIDGIDDWAV